MISCSEITSLFSHLPLSFVGKKGNFGRMSSIRKKLYLEEMNFKRCDETYF